MSLQKCNTCNAEFSYWQPFAEGGENVERCPVCNNTKQMSDAVIEFKGQTSLCEKLEAVFKEPDAVKTYEPKIHTGKPGVSGGGLVHDDSADAIRYVTDAVPDHEGLMEQVSRGIMKQVSRHFITESDMTVHPFRVVTGEMFNLYRKKNHDYGNSFSEQFQELGMASSIIRLSDKLSRLKSLHSKPQQVTDESTRDTLIDLANYAVMTIMELDRESKEVGR